MTNIDCYIIAGGSSLDGFDFSALKGATRIGVDGAAFTAGCDVLVSVVRDFTLDNKDALDAFEGEKIIAAPRSRMEEPLEGVTYMMMGYGDGFGLEGELRGYESGFAALNLAWQRGYKKIGLLGFDMLDNARWAERFNSVANMVDCVNFVGEDGSAITAFPTQPLSDLNPKPKKKRNETA